jgi:hypothetical protein
MANRAYLFNSNVESNNHVDLKLALEKDGEGAHRSERQVDLGPDQRSRLSAPRIA